MKKLCFLFLAAAMLLSLAACSGAGSSRQSAPESSAPAGESSSRSESASQPESSSSEAAEAPADSSEPIDDNGTKVLVAYFSATGTTKKLAEYAADAMGADLYEIVPQQPYTDDDLNYNDKDSRSTLEMDDPSARPAISGEAEDMDSYDIVFLGYPIWWGEAPRIISTFLESYDFSGKTIVPFCTSGGSGMGSSASNLHPLCSDGAVWLEGGRLSSSSTRDDIASWLNGLGLDLKVE